MIDPFLLNLRSIATINRYIDTVGILEKGGEIILSAGSGEKEKINGVLPLFSEKKDSDLKPFLRSELFHILMTFNVCGNVDTINQECYLSLLASTLVYLQNQKSS